MRIPSRAVRVPILVSGLLLLCLVSTGTAAPQIQGGEVILKFKAGASQSAIDAILADLHATPLHRFGRIQAEHDRISGGWSVPDAIARYRNDPAIDFIEPNYIVSIVRTPDDPLFPQLWGLRNTGQTGGLPGADISATEAWDTSTGSSDVIVGVIDTGIDYTHPDLAGNIYVNAGEIAGNGIDDDGNGFIDDVRGWDFINHDNNPMDDNGHGTHVSGTVGGIGNNGIGVTGVSWSVRLMPLKFLGAGGSGSTADAIAAIEYATQMGVNIMSNSWGGGGFSEALRLAIQDAGNAGIYFVAAAGNAANNNDVFPAYPASYDLPNIISVAATNSLDQLADFSNFGATSVDLGAPGTDILSTLPSAQYGLLSGTSMATPHVSGALALILARFPSISVSDGKALLLNTVDPLPTLSGKVLSGGRLNIAKALEGPDSIAPGTIVDLEALTPTSNGVTLQWTATGDDGASGTVSGYEIRFASFEITEANFNAATLSSVRPEPHPAGSEEQTAVTGLDFSTTYYFAIKARDEYGNRSPISNVASATTLGPPDIDVSPTALSAALLTGDKQTQTLTLKNLAAGTLDFSLGVLTGAPGSGVGTGGPSPSRIPEDVLAGGSGSHRWSDYARAAATSPTAGPILPAGAVRTATLPDVITDPSGDGGSVDLTVLRGLGDRGTLQIEMELSTPIDRFNFGGYLSLDTDRNPATGFPPSAGNGLQDIGAEYEFTLFSLSSGIVNLYDTLHGSFVGSFPVEIGTRTLRFSVPLSLLGNDDGTMDVTGVIGNAVGPTDWFPNSGHGSILGIQFLSFDPSSGTVPPGGTVDVRVTFDATGLFGGAYDASIRVASNDPDEAEVLVPAHLDVTGAPDIALSSVAVDYGPVFLGVSKPATIVVSNVGTDLLTVTGLTVSPADFSVDPSGFSLEPGASHDVIVTLSPQGVGAIEGQLTISSNDHDEGSVTVALHGDGLIAPDISVDPSAFTASLKTGETASSVLTVSNTGGSDLTFGIKTRRPPLASGVVGSPVSLPSSLRTPTRNQTGPDVGPPSVRAEYQGTFVRFGITDFGEIMPFQSPLGFEHLAVGTFLSGYTVAYMAGGVDHVCYSVNSDRSDVVPVSYREIENTPSRVSVEVVTRTADGVLGIRRVFTFPRERKHVVVTTELQNLSSSAVTQVVLKEDTDWDMDGDFDDDGWDYDRPRNMVYAWDEHYGAVGADRVPDQMDIYGWNDYASRTTTIDVPSGPALPFDGLEVLHFELGVLEPSQKRPVTMAYAVGSSLAELQQEMDASVGVPWLSVSPESGVVPVGGSAQLAVRFDPGTLTTGDYAGQVVVESNDPDEAEVALPASMHVTGVPDLALSAGGLDFGSPFLGQVVTRALQVTNVGTGRLEIASVTADLPAYSVDTPAFTLDPLQSRAVTVTFSPSSPGVQNSILAIVSNDPDEGSAMVALHGEGLIAPIVGVTPSSLNAALLTGESTSRSLTVRNTGGSDLHFEVAFQAAALAAATTASLRTSSHEAPPMALPARASVKYLTSMGSASFASTAVPAALATANGTLVAPDSIPTGSDILVLSTTSIDTSLLRALGELGHGYDLIYTQDFTGIDFTPYRTIVVAMDGGLISENSCQALAGAAAGGRLLFMLGGTNYTPYYNGVQTYLLSHTGETGWIQSAPPHLSVVDAADVLASGLPSSYTFVGSFLSYYMLRIDDPATRVAVRNGDHHPALVHKSLGAGTLVYYINPPDSPFWGNPSDYAILKQIVKNALALGGPAWLSAEPRSGTVSPGGSVDVTVTFNATGLFGGAYDASVQVGSNDPSQPNVLIPAHMDVTGVPNITLSSPALSFGTIFVGLSKPATVVVSNVGTDQLTVSGVTASPGDFTVDTSGFSLAPGASHDVVVTFSPQSAAAIDGLLTITSNDPDQGTATVSLHGDGLIAPRIAVTPTSLRADLLSGETSSQALMIQNDGGSDLVFDVTLTNFVFPVAAPAATAPGRTPSEIVSEYNQYRANPPGAPASPPHPSPQPGIMPIWEQVQSALSDSFIIFHDDVEGGSNGWTHYATNPAGTDQWNISTARASSGSRSWQVSQHAGIGADALQSPAIDLSGYRNALLTFKHWYNFDDCSDPNFEPDGGIVEVSSDGGSTWTQIIPMGGYPYILDDICGNTLAFRAAYSHDGGNGATFIPAVFDLSPFTGHSVRIRFHAGWDCGNCSFNEGWYIDDITVYSRAPRFVTVAPRSGTVAAGSSLNLGVDFDATGLQGGAYKLDLVVASNDPVTPSKAVPVTMHVIGVPLISVTPTSLAFAPLFVGQSSTQFLTVKNSGTEVLSVTAISSSEGSYSANPTAFDLEPQASQIVAVTFAPSSIGTKDGALSITHNASGSPTSVPLSGSAILPPILTSSPDEIRVRLNPGAVTAETVTIGNTGGSDLQFVLDVRSPGAAVAVSTDPPLAKGEEDRRVGAPVALRTGGPDLFGHRWIDSDSPGGPVFNWLNIVPAGTRIPLTGDDVTSAPIPIGFPFHFFGTEFSTVRVSTNGYLSFTSALADYSNQPLPSTGAPENLLAVFWDDLYFDAFSNAFYYNDGGRFIVQFINVQSVSGGGPYTFEVILYPTGAIVYQYLSMSPPLTSATIGFQNAARSDGLTVVFNNNYVHNNLAVRIDTGLPWLSLNLLDGAVPPGGSIDVRAFLNTTGLSLGDHQGVIDMYTNDPVSSIRSIPVTLHVNGDDPPIVSAPASVSGAEGVPLTFSVAASDPEGDRMYSLTAAPLPPGATFVANDAYSAGDLHWTPDYDQAGSFTVTISATSARHAKPVSGPVDPLEGSATVQITIANTDRAPIVTAPATQTVAEGVLLTFTVSATDPDGEPVATLDVGELPVGATYTPDPALPRGTFAWTPTFSNAGDYRVTFTASNALVGSATIAITVTDQNRAPVANAGGPYSGMADVPIAFDGTKSFDPDGDPLQFTWSFGDGDLGSGPSPTHTYRSMVGSPFTVTLTVSDGSLSSTGTTTATLQSTFAANVFFPLNLNYFFPQILPGWVRVEPIGNSFMIADVLLSTIRMSYNGMSIPARCKSILDHDRNHNGIAEIRVCFTRDDLRTLFLGLPNGTSDVQVTLEGDLLSGGRFRGTATVHVVKFSFLGSGSLALVSPNPLNPRGTLTFVTTEPGMASAQLFDLKGRLVRNLLPREYFLPGGHQVMVDGRNEQGSQLASGVYYYRVESVNGISKGAITILK